MGTNYLSSYSGLYTTRLYTDCNKLRVDGRNPVNNGIFTISTGAGFLRFTGVNPSAVRCLVCQEIVLDEEDEDLQIHVTCTKVSNISDSSWGGSPEKKKTLQG